MVAWGGLFSSCFHGCVRASTEEHHRSSGSLSSVVADDWQSVPDDVLQAVLVYLPAADVARARLTCRHWRCTLSAYTHALCIPTRFLSSRGARSALQRAGGVFPSVREVTLHQAAGWCDPVQARMDMEPLVRLESRLVGLEPLAAGLPGVRRLALADAHFTRDPWPLSQLAWLKGLRGLELRWDTALWAPGQVLQEGEALQPLFGLHALTELALCKSAHLFLGEVCLGDTTLASAAAGLRNLARLRLSTVRLGDDGVSALGLLPQLTHLSLRGQVNATLGALGRAFAAATRLEELELGTVVPSNGDLRRISAAHVGGRRARGGGGGGGAGAGGRGSAAAAAAAAEAQQRRQQRRQQRAQAAAAAAAAAAAGAGGDGGAAAGPALPAGPRASSSSSGGGGGSGSGSGSGGSGSSGGGGRRGGGSGGGGGHFSGEDWSAVLSPLTCLRRLRLQSDLVLLGSCEALRGMASVTHLELHGGAKFLAAGPFASLPPSWLSRLAEQGGGGGGGGGGASGGGGSAGAFGGIGGGGRASWCATAPAGQAAVVAGGAWPALVSLQVDSLQSADGLADAVARLESLRTLVVSGPCLLAQRHAFGVGGGGAGALAGAAAGGARGAAQPGQRRPAAAAAEGQHARGASQLPPRLPGPSGAGAGGKRAVPNAAARRKRVSFELGDDSPGSSGSGGSGGGTSGGSGGSGSRGSGGRSPQHRTGAAPASGAAGAEPRARGPERPAAPGPAAQRGLSGLSDPQAQPQDFWAGGPLPRDRGSSGGGGMPGRGARAAGAGAGAPPAGGGAASAAAHGLVELGGLLGRGGAGPAAGPGALPADLDLLSRLSPLQRLSTFHLHLQHNMPCGLCMTPFSLSHLAATWGQLTSLSLDVAPPASGAGAGPHGAPAPAASSSAGAGGGGGGGIGAADAAQVVAALSALTTLRDLSLRMAADPVAAAAAAAEQCGGRGGSFSSCGLDPPDIPWASLPAGLESLSLHGVGLDGEGVLAMGAAAPGLRHLRLLHCRSGSGPLWSMQRAWPGLATLVVKEAPAGGAGASGVAAVAGLRKLRALGLTLEPAADVSALGDLESLRYLLLDGRSNSEVQGVKALRRLTSLRALVLPLLHLHHADRPALASLQLALPDTLVSNVSANFGLHHGCHWFQAFSLEEREWWREPAAPWAWHPALAIAP